MGKSWMSMRCMYSVTADGSVGLRMPDSLAATGMATTRAVSRIVRTARGEAMAPNVSPEWITPPGASCNGFTKRPRACAVEGGGKRGPWQRPRALLGHEDDLHQAQPVVLDGPEVLGELAERRPTRWCRQIGRAHV